MRRASNWNAAKRNASLTEFRRLLDGHRKEQVQNAIHAGRALAKLVADSVCTIAALRLSCSPWQQGKSAAT